MARVINWADIAESINTSGVRKQILEGDGATLVKVTIAGGVTGSKHSHPHEQFVQVIEGSGVLETEQGASRFGPGDLFHFPPNAWHAASFETETVLVETNLTA